MEHREETIEVEATLKVRCKYPVWINNRITKEEEKERILDLISNNPDKELMNEDFELVELIELVEFMSLSLCHQRMLYEI